MLTLSEKSRPVVEATLPVVAEHINEIAQRFYRHMFAEHPELLDGTMAHGWLLFADGDVVSGRTELMETAPAALARGSIRIALWAYAWFIRDRLSATFSLRPVRTLGLRPVRNTAIGG